MTKFLQAYIAAALWSTTDDAEMPLDANYTEHDLAPETLHEMTLDCEAFEEQAEGLYSYDDAEQAGHDFWLTRNGHGAGFWDGDWSEPEASRLDEIAKSFGSYDLYVGDDGKLYGM